MLGKTYKIETKRLILRPYQPKDAVLLKQAVDASRDHLRPWLSWVKHKPESVEVTLERIRKWRGQFDLGEDYVFGIFNKEDGTLVGSTGLHNRLGRRTREIGYWLHAKHIRKGYALEAVTALTRVVFSVELLERVEIRCARENVRAQNIPKKIGYFYEGILANGRSDGYGTKRDVAIWSMFIEDFMENPIPSIKTNKAFNILGELI